MAGKNNLIQNAKDLEVYKLAFSCAVRLHKITLEFPKYEQFEIASQIRRASKSICANLSEGFAKQYKSQTEFYRFVTIAAGSAKEVQTWIDFSYELGYIDKEKYSKIYDNYEKIFAMLLKLKK